MPSGESLARGVVDPIAGALAIKSHCCRSRHGCKSHDSDVREGVAIHVLTLNAGFDGAVNAIAVCNRSRQRFEHQYDDGFADADAVGLFGEAVALAVLRYHARLARDTAQGKTRRIIAGSLAARCACGRR